MDLTFRTQHDHPAKKICEKCRQERKTLYDYNGEQWCGTCISRYERQVNTREMYGHGRRGY